MKMNGNMHHSTRSQANQNQQLESDRVFWENVPNPEDIKRECLWGRAEAVAATQHMTSSNLWAFREDSRFAARRIEQHVIPELPDITPIPDATVNSGPDAEAFPQELTNYTEEISSQRIPPMVYIEGNNRENLSTRVSRSGKTNENSRNLLNCGCWSWSVNRHRVGPACECCPNGHMLD